MTLDGAEGEKNLTFWLSHKFLISPLSALYGDQIKVCEWSVCADLLKIAERKSIKSESKCFKGQKYTIVVIIGFWPTINAQTNQKFKVCPMYIDRSMKHRLLSFFLWWNQFLLVRPIIIIVKRYLNYKIKKHNWDFKKFQEQGRVS